MIVTDRQPKKHPHLNGVTMAMAMAMATATTAVAVAVVVAVVGDDTTIWKNYHVPIAIVGTPLL